MFNRRRSLIWWNNLNGGKEDRDRKRSLRRTLIHEKKVGIIRDLALGHNIGDYNMDPPDLSIMIRLGPHSTFEEIERLYEKYRGSKISRQ